MIPYLLPTAVAGEPFWSRIERAAFTNGKRDAQSLLANMNIDPIDLGLGKPAAVERAAMLFATQPGDITYDTPVYYSDHVWNLRGHLIDSNMLDRSGERFCPKCVEQKESTVRPLAWYLRPVTACPIHGVTLVETSPAKAVKCDSTDASAYLTHRLGLPAEDVLSAPLLDALTWRTAAKLIFFIGYELEHSASKRRDARPDQAAMERGFHAVRNEQSLRKTLDILKERALPAKEIGMNRLFGKTFMSMFKPGMAPELAGVVDIVADHALDHLPQRDESILQGHPPRVWTIVAGAKQLDIHPKTLTQVVSTYDQNDYFVRHKLISGPVFADLQKRLADTMPQHEMFERFGLTALPGKALANAGIIKPVYPRHRHKRLYSAHDMVALIDSYSTEAVIVGDLPDGLLSIPDAAAAIRRSILSVVEAVRDKRIKVLARLQEPSFNGLFINPAELRACFFGEATSGVVLQRAAAKALRTNEKAFKALQEEKFITAITEHNPIPRQIRTVVQKSSLLEFHAKYVLSGEIVRRSDLGFANLRREMTRLGVTEIENDIPVAMFLRADVEPHLKGNFEELVF